MAKTVSRVSRTIVSTDSEEIASVALAYGAEVPFKRPCELALDDSPEWLVWRHALEFLKKEGRGYPDALLVLPVTSPLRAVEDLEQCLNVFHRNAPDMVITVTESHRNPFFNMVKVRDDGFVDLAITGEKTFVRRQDAPAIYDMTTVAYVAKPEFIMTKCAIFEGVVRHVVIPKERAIDIDSMFDFEIAQCLVDKRRGAEGS